MEQKIKANLDVLNVLPGLEENVENYLIKLNQNLTESEIRNYLIKSIENHTAGKGNEVLKYSKQQGTLDQYSNYELARLDLGLQFNTYYYNLEDIVTEDMVDEYIIDGIHNIILD
jgi:hypothetical protein